MRPALYQAEKSGAGDLVAASGTPKEGVTQQQAEAVEEQQEAAEEAAEQQEQAGEETEQEQAGESTETADENNPDAA
jgi:hypothetical protein